MKLSLEDVKPVMESDPLVLFHQGNRSPETDRMYTHMLKRVLCGICEDMLDGTFEERASEFVWRSRENPTWCRDMMLGISRLMRERTELPAGDPDRMSPSTIPTYFAPVKKLLEMNDVSIPWKRVHMTFPERKAQSDARGWTREEISRLLVIAENAKYRAVILLLASSGMRKGGLRLLWKDFTPICRDGDALSESGSGSPVCVAVRVYRGSAEEYTTFVTPEAWEAMQEWRTVWASEVGRPPNPDDPVFKREGMFPMMVGHGAINSGIERIIGKSGLRDGHDTDGKRYCVPAIHGFRRFWNKTVKDAMSDDSPVSSLTKKEYMMGHTGMAPMDRNYYHTNTLELAKEYLNAVPGLTINGERRQQHESMPMGERKDYEAKIDRMEQMILKLSARMNALNA